MSIHVSVHASAGHIEAVITNMLMTTTLITNVLITNMQTFFYDHVFGSQSTNGECYDVKIII